MKKPFKNRLTQESESFLNELKSKVNIVIKDKCYNLSHQGLYAFTINLSFTGILVFDKEGSYPYNPSSN